ncbi:MAG: hypothetical protein K8R85_16240 [Bacteroidetes bacterium]|nr:hypothetical protein [Bacteroidota bacterium]
MNNINTGALNYNVCCPTESRSIAGGVRGLTHILGSVQYDVPPFALSSD